MALPAGAPEPFRPLHLGLSARRGACSTLALQLVLALRELGGELVAHPSVLLRRRELRASQVVECDPLRVELGLHR